MVRSFSIALFLLLNLIQLSGQEIEWISWEELNDKMKTHPKKVIVSFNKSNCPWCEEMETKVMGSEDIANYINKTFYPLKLSVAENRNIVIKDKTYRLDRDGIHQLAKVLSRNQISFPMLVFVNEQFQIIQPIAGIQSRDKLRNILVYFGEDYFQEIPWKRFIQVKDAEPEFNNSPLLIKGK